MATIDEQLAEVKASLGISTNNPNCYLLRMESTELFNPTSPDFKTHLLAHYKFGKELKDNGTLVLAGRFFCFSLCFNYRFILNLTLGPSDTFGLFILKVSSREEAEAISANEPFGKGRKSLCK